MNGVWQFWQQADPVIRAVAALLLLMSVSAWVLIFWKGWLLQRVRGDLRRGVPAFWAATSLTDGREQLRHLDREQMLTTLVDAASAVPPPGTLEAHGLIESQLTRRLRDALHRVLDKLQFGQVLLATVGATAPFFGLLDHGALEELDVTRLHVGDPANRDIRRERPAHRRPDDDRHPVHVKRMREPDGGVPWARVHPCPWWSSEPPTGKRKRLPMAPDTSRPVSPPSSTTAIGCWVAAPSPPSSTLSN